MGSINLKSELTRAHSRSSGADNSQPVPKKDEYTFKDIRMDIQFASNANNLPANRSPTAIDLEAALTKAGYSGGTYNVQIHCLRQHMIGMPI